MEYLPLTHAQGWCLGEMQKIRRPGWYCVEFLVRTMRPMDETAMSRAVSFVVNRYEALRVKFAFRGGKWLQEVYPLSDARPFAAYDFSGISINGRMEAMKNMCIKERNWLNLEKGNLVRVLFFRFSETEGRLWFCIHHVIADLVSSIIFTREFMNAYAQLTRGNELKWHVLKEQRKMLYLLDGYCGDVLVPSELDYWSSLPWEKAATVRSDYPELFFSLELAIRALDGKSLIDFYRTDLITIDPEQSALMFSQFGAQLENGLIGIFFLAVTHCLGLEWMDMDVCNSGRNILPSDYGINYANLLGYFSLNRAALLRRPGKGELAADLRDISDQLREIPNAGLGYTLIPHYIRDERLRNAFYELRKRPLVFFNYMGRTDSNFGNDEFEISREDCGRSIYAWEVQTNMLECEVRIEESQLLVKLTYCSAYFKASTIQAIRVDMEQMLQELNSTRIFPSIEKVA